ncbi:phosphate/phosphite/phosphonate ABC transporter substrate-binding protein [Shewanella kaireitica]|uniref:phosphate/phosphite/phosphonate ABC transporter substrate-binding protein n=1 Tax=Shewanella kaireitica TaxID=212021 RepID=UPI00200C388E|nr:phosphate/phosphite/phosphonate ABC transporter substrate-binding protein [Shewanella kaireitica]MCL1095757.1 phosphate/phosphite/phosphonate ABC transporter substrate-binding protein [Shewanella kaireitica]
MYLLLAEVINIVKCSKSAVAARLLLSATLVFSLLVWSVNAAEDAAQASAETLVFGVVPQQAASTLAKAWGPLLKELSQNAKVDLRFATAPDIPTFEARVAKGEYDVAYMNPHHYAQFHQSQGYQALVKEKDKKLKGIIVVAKDASFQSLDDLAGETIAFPAPGAFAASMIPRASLKQRNIEFKPQYVGSHDSVYLAVSQGLFNAGGGVGRTFNNLPIETQSKLRILWTTPKYTPHAIAVHPRVSAHTRKILIAELVALSQSEFGRSLLNNLGFKRLEPAVDSDWDDVRSLELDQLSVPIIDETPLQEKR